MRTEPLHTADVGAGSSLATPTILQPALDSIEVREALRSATRRIAPLWQLESFVAVNPYLGLTDLTFAEAAGRLESVAGARHTLPLGFYRDAIDRGRITHGDLGRALGSAGGDPAEVDALLSRLTAATDSRHASTSPGGNGSATCLQTAADAATTVTGTDWSTLMVERVAAWAAAYFDGGQAMWRSADATISPFSAWRAEAAIDRTPDVLGLRRFRSTVRSLPEDPVEAATAALGVLGIDGTTAELYLHALLLRLAGWSGYAARIVWDAELLGRDDDTLVELLAVLVCWEASLLTSLSSPELDRAWSAARDEIVAVGHDTGPAPSSASALALVLQEAFDIAEQRRLVAQVGANAGGSSTEVAPATADAPADAPADAAASTVRPRAQTVFCIDVRSEVFRRHLESVAPDVDTIGFAGFFGIPVEFVPLAHATGTDQCPVLLRPGYTVQESIADPQLRAAAVQQRGLSHSVRRAWKSFKMGAISCFSFVGPVGLIYLPKLFTDGFGRTRPVRRAEIEGIDTEAALQLAPTLELDAASPGAGIAASDRVDLAEGALRAMSLTSGFAPLVVIAGHGSSTVNNPYDNGLDCGACGGHTGEANARVAVMILNDPAVRAGLAERGIEVPDDTVFVAALHDTTTDVIAWFDESAVPQSHRSMLDAVTQDLAAAGAGARRERARRMGIDPDSSDVDAAVLSRSTDWAQVRPEWGLAGCRAFVIAPRGRTAGTDLAGQAFLHSYDWRADDGFGVLELLMTAPMVVASWISLQYYGSTVENRLFGSGNKTLHNVVGRLGVLEGTAGDLRTGLPWQSVHDGTNYQHEPVRLNVMIEAPLDAMNQVLADHPGVRELVDNGWIHLLAIDDTGVVAHRYAGDLTWEQVAA